MMNSINKFLFIYFLIFYGTLFGQKVVGRIHYGGGGDWYGNRTVFTNVFNFIENETGMRIARKEESVKLTESSFTDFPLLYIAGHGNIKFNDTEVEKLRDYLMNGGFLWADDDFGMDLAFRREMNKVFPGAEWVEVSFDHLIYHILFDFPNGLPKVHEHNGGAPKGLGLFYKGNLVVFYTYNTDISDGCEDEDIHHDDLQVRKAALQMASNIILYALSQ